MSYFFDFKIILAFIISFGIAYIIGPMLLPMLKKLKFGKVKVEKRNYVVKTTQ